MNTDERKTIAIDIDDVVASVMEAVHIWANEKTGATLPRDVYYNTTANYWSYYDSIWSEHGLSDQVNFDMVLNELAEDQSHIPVVEGARETLAMLKNRYNLVFITSRPTYQKDATRRWLDERISAEIPLYMSHNPMANAEARSKGEICADLGASYLIDDNIGNCQNAAEYGVEPLLFGAYGWNDAAPASLRRFTSWDAIGEYLLSDAH